MSGVTMAWLRYHWDEVYTFAITNGTYTGRASFGNHYLLEDDSPEELLIKVRRHYPGTRADLCST